MKLTPILTEKSLVEAEKGNYTFWVDRRLNKYQIKKLVGEIFEVTVVNVRTINVAEETDETSTRLENLYTIDDVIKNLYKVCYSIAPNLKRDQLKAVYSIVK